MLPSDNQGAGAPPSLVYLGLRALRFWKGAAALVVVGAIATVLIAKRTPQPYRSDAVLVFDNSVPNDVTSQDPERAGAGLRDLLLKTERLRDVVKQFYLYPELTTQQGVEMLRKMVQFNVQQGATFSVSFQSESPQQAQAVLNSLVASFIKDHNEQRARSVEDLSKFLAEGRGHLKKEVEKREQALREFLGKHPEVANMNEPIPTTDDPSLLLLEQQAAQLRAQLRSQAAGRARVGKGADSRSLAELETLRKQQEEFAQKARQELQDQLDKHTEEHPDVILAREKAKRAEGQLARFDAQIEAAAAAAGAKGPGGPSPEDQMLAQNIRDIEGRMFAMRASNRERVKRSRDPRLLQMAIELERLRHELGESREALSRAEDQAMQADVLKMMATKGEVLRLKILDEPSLPGSPVQSRRRRTAMLGLALSCLLAAGLALGRAMTSDRIFDRADLVHLAGANVLVVVPRVPKSIRRTSG